MKTIKDLKNKYQYSGLKGLIIGCGESALQMKTHKKDIGTIYLCINDSGSIIDPDILLVSDMMSRFKNNRREIIKNTSAAMYVCMDKFWEFNENKTYFFGATKDSFEETLLPKNDNNLKAGYDSPFMAIQLLMKMGIKEIGLIGVDYTNKSIYGESVHELINVVGVDRLNYVYSSLIEFAEHEGCALYNLSDVSHLEMDKMSIKEFINFK